MPTNPPERIFGLPLKVVANGVYYLTATICGLLTVWVLISLEKWVSPALSSNKAVRVINIVLLTTVATRVANWTRSRIPGYHKPRQIKWVWTCQTTSPIQPDIESSILLVSRQFSGVNQAMSFLIIVLCLCWAVLGWRYSPLLSLWGIFFTLLAVNSYCYRLAIYGNRDTTADARGIVLTPQRIIPWSSIVKAQFGANVWALNTIENSWVFLYDTQGKRVAAFAFGKGKFQPLLQLMDVLHQTLGLENTIPSEWLDLTAPLALRTNQPPHSLQLQTRENSNDSPNVLKMEISKILNNIEALVENGKAGLLGKRLIDEEKMLREIANLKAALAQQHASPELTAGMEDLEKQVTSSKWRYLGKSLIKEEDFFVQIQRLRSLLKPRAKSEFGPLESSVLQAINSVEQLLAETKVGYLGQRLVNEELMQPHLSELQNAVANYIAQKPKQNPAFRPHLELQEAVNTLVNMVSHGKGVMGKRSINEEELFVAIQRLRSIIASSARKETH